MSNHSTESDEGNVVVGERGRKRARQPEKWKMNVSKESRNTGKEYVSCFSGKVIEAKKIGASCADGCFKK